MIELTDQEKQVIKKVVDKMVADGGLFAGNYDAENGNEDFMYGISVALEYFAHLVDENYGTEFYDKFIMNMIKSEEKKIMMRTAEKYIFDELSVEVPEGEIPASWFDENDLPMVVECTCCGSTMVLLSAMIDDNGFCFCRECAPID